MRQTATAYVRYAPVTTLLMGLSVVVSLFTELGENLEVVTWFTLADLKDYDRTIASGTWAVLRGEVWRLITPIFLHFGALHILLNMMWLKDLGYVIERRWSSTALIAVVVTSAAISNAAQFVVDWDLRNGVRTANVLSGGMSGVVYGLLGYLWIRGRFEPNSGIRVPPSMLAMMFGWLVLCMTGFLGSIANTAHLVGLIVGILCAVLSLCTGAFVCRALR